MPYFVCWVAFSVLVVDVDGVDDFFDFGEFVDVPTVDEDENVGDQVEEVVIAEIIF